MEYAPWNRNAKMYIPPVYKATMPTTWPIHSPSLPQSARLVTKTHKNCKCARIRLPPPDVLLLQPRRSKKRVSRVLTKKCTETTTAIPSKGKDQPILLRRGLTYLTFRKRGTCRGMISSSPLDRECVSEHIVVVLLSYLHGTSLFNGSSSRLVRVLEM